MVVGRLGLDEAHEDVGSGVDLVVIQHVVLAACAPQPHGAGVRLDEHAAAVVEVDLFVVCEVELVVGDPEPAVLDVHGALGGDVEEQECGDALILHGGGLLGGLGAGVGLELCAG